MYYFFGGLVLVDFSTDVTLSFSQSVCCMGEREGWGGHCNHLEQRCTVLNLLSV